MRRCGSAFAATCLLALLSSPVLAGDDEDPLLASLDTRNQLPAGLPRAADPAGTRLDLGTAADGIVFTVPKGCAAWRVGDDRTALTMSCSRAAWPKLNGTVTIELLPGQRRLESINAPTGWQASSLDARCEAALGNCSALRLDGRLFGGRSDLHFSASVWDGVTARALRQAIMAAALPAVEGGPTAKGPSAANQD